MQQTQLVQQRERSAGRREQQAAHRQYREAEAQRRTEELDARGRGAARPAGRGVPGTGVQAAASRGPSGSSPSTPGVWPSRCPCRTRQYQAQSAAGRAGPAGAGAARGTRPVRAGLAGRAGRGSAAPAATGRVPAAVRPVGADQLAEIRGTTPGSRSWPRPARGRPRGGGGVLLGRPVRLDGLAARACRGRCRPRTTRPRASWCWTGSCPGTPSCPRPSRCGTCRARTRTRRRARPVTAAPGAVPGRTRAVRAAGAARAVRGGRVRRAGLGRRSTASWTATIRRPAGGADLPGHRHGGPVASSPGCAWTR